MGTIIFAMESWLETDWRRSCDGNAMESTRKGVANEGVDVLKRYVRWCLNCIWLYYSLQTTAHRTDDSDEERSCCCTRALRLKLMVIICDMIYNYIWMFRLWLPYILWEWVYFQIVLRWWWATTRECGLFSEWVVVSSGNGVVWCDSIWRNIVWLFCFRERYLLDWSFASLFRWKKNSVCSFLFNLARWMRTLCFFTCWWIFFWNVRR